MNAAASQIGSGDEEWSSDRPFYLEAAAIKDLFDDPPENIYRSLDRATRKLMRRVITYRFTPEGRKREVEIEEHWVRRAIYDKEKSRVVLYWEDSVIPYLTQLSREFTQYRLEEISSLTGKWAPRLYQLLMTYRSVGKMEITVDEMRYALQAGKSYKDVPILNRAVLKPAVAEIQAKLPELGLRMAVRRPGRQITHFQFTFAPSTVRQEQDRIEQAKTEPKDRPRWQAAKEKRATVRDKLRDITDVSW